MKRKQILKIIIDIAMTVLFLALMAYHITGESLHEWLGISLFILFIMHHILNWNWYKGLLRGRYSASRILITIVNFLLFASMIGMMISGILLSREVFGFLNLRAGMFGRRLHMISTAWGFCLMAVHVGLHWGMVVGMAKKLPVRGKRAGAAARMTAGALALYGIYAFASRQIGERMFLLMEYAFFDYDEPAVFFFWDYVCIMILFAALSYYSSKLLRKRKTSQGREMDCGRAVEMRSPAHAFAPKQKNGNEEGA